jgi:hypothetical protein
MRAHIRTPRTRREQEKPLVEVTHAPQPEARELLVELLLELLNGTR